MDLIKTGMDLSKTIRNVTRLKEIVLVFAKHGFDEFISLGVTRNIPNFALPKSKRSIKQELKESTNRDWSQIIGYRLRLCFEELGPAFIKFGQLLSSREDIFDSSFINEMKLLRDKVKTVQFSEVKASIEDSLGRPIEEVFSSIEEKAIGTASIGVVYRGVLQTGEKVVLKVRRPNIEKVIQTDFSILKFLVTQAEKASNELRYLGISRIVNEFSGSIIHELNFNIEVLNAVRFKTMIENLDRANLLYIPKIYSGYTKENMLIMEYLDGIRFSDEVSINLKKEEIVDKLNDGLKIFLKTFLKEGFFHADLHGGNLILLSNGKIGLIDFGLMGRLSPKGRKSFIALVYSLLTFNYENLVFEFLDVAEYESTPDVDSLISDVREVLSPYIGLTVQQTDYNLIFRESITVLRRHEIYLPSEWFIVFRALVTLDGVGQALGQDFDLYGMMEDDIHEIIKDSFNKDELIEEGVWVARDMISLGRVLPRHFKWYLKEWAKKGYAHEIALTGHEISFNKIAKSLKFLGYTLLCSVFIICGVYFLNPQKVDSFSDIPTIVWVFWSLGIVAFVKGFLRG